MSKKHCYLLRCAAMLMVAALAALLAARGVMSHYLWSLGLIALLLALFFLRFERRRKPAWELASLAVLCALAVASRAVFSFVPHCKPMAAVVMLAGISFGAESGFLCGAVSVFASNFLFGQGPWTPWQMLAFGLAGFLAGICAKGKLLPKTVRGRKDRLILAAFGFLTVLLIVGPVLDSFSLVAFPGASVGLRVFWAGIIPNCLHASATALLLLSCGGPMLDELTRIQKKYGFGEEGGSNAFS